MGLHSPFTIFRLPVSIPWGTEGGRGSLPIALLAAAPIVLPAAYMAYVLAQGARRSTASARITPPDPLVSRRSKASAAAAEGGDTRAIPPAVLAAPDQYVVARERVVSDPVPLQSIRPDLRRQLKSRGKIDGAETLGLLQTYLATTMRLFTWTPQAFVMRTMVSRLPGGAAHAGTFSAPYLEACRFEAGDRVCGVYMVRERVGGRAGQRVFLDLSPPEGWEGPVVSGVLDCGFVVEEKEGQRCVRFVNETVMWRRRDEKPTLLEGAVSRWLHTLMIGWMMMRGVEAVTGDSGRGKVKTA